VTNISTLGDSAHRHTATDYRHDAYFANGWDAMQIWDGYDTGGRAVGVAMSNSGTDAFDNDDITEPNAQTAPLGVTAGLHLIRYRYLSSRTGAVSNPSIPIEFTAVGGYDLQIPVGDDSSDASNIQRHPTAGVRRYFDRIVIEMTVAAGTVYFKALEIDGETNTAGGGPTAANITLSDDALAQNPLLWNPGANDHEQPPRRRIVLSHRGHLFSFGTVIHNTGTASVTNGTTTVTLGTASTSLNAAMDEGGWQIRFGTEATAYKVASGTNSTTLELAVNHSGGASAVAYKLFNVDNSIYVSRAGYPESWNSSDRFIAGPTNEGASNLTGGCAFGHGIVFYGLTTADYFAWSTDPVTDGSRSPIAGKRGAVSHQVVINVEGACYALDRQGIWRYRGQGSEHLSDPVDTFFFSTRAGSTINWAAVETFHCAWHANLRCIRWFVALDANTVPYDYIQLDVDTEQWSTGSFEMAIECSKQIPTAQGMQTIYGDENGHLWIADTSLLDGGTSSNAYAVLTVGASATTTSIPTSSTSLPTALSGLDGMFCYHVSSGESRLITANTADTLTTSAFSTAPVEGDAIWLGRIVGTLKTKAFTGNSGPGEQMRPRHLHLAFEPSGEARYLRVRLIEDFAGAAKTYGATRASLTEVLAPASLTDTDWRPLLNTEDGYVRMPAGMNFNRFVEVEIESPEPFNDFELFGVAIDGVEGEPPS